MAVFICNDFLLLCHKKHHHHYVSSENVTKSAQIIDLNKLGKSPGDISKQLQVPRSTVQTTVYKYRVHGTAGSLP